MVMNVCVVLVIVQALSLLLSCHCFVAQLWSPVFCQFLNICLCNIVLYEAWIVLFCIIRTKLLYFLCLFVCLHIRSGFWFLPIACQCFDPCYRVLWIPILCNSVLPLTAHTTPTSCPHAKHRMISENPPQKMHDISIRFCVFFGFPVLTRLLNLDAGVKWWI